MNQLSNIYLYVCIVVFCLHPHQSSTRFTLWVLCIHHMKFSESKMLPWEIYYSQCYHNKLRIFVEIGILHKYCAMYCCNVSRIMIHYTLSSRNGNEILVEVVLFIMYKVYTECFINNRNLTSLLWSRALFSQGKPNYWAETKMCIFRQTKGHRQEKKWNLVNTSWFLVLCINFNTNDLLQGS